MEIWNHFTFREDLYPHISNYIKRNGIPYEKGDIISSVNISENDPHWKVIKKLLKDENNLFYSETVFTKEELMSAEWLTVRSKWYFDYPQPENNYTRITYTKDELCSFADCGIELIQTDSFRFKRTPKWGKRNFFMTNWVYDELFVSSKAKELLESSDLEGISFSNVKTKNGKEILDDVYQLQIAHILSPGINKKSSCVKEVFTCPICGKQKMRANGRGQLVFCEESFANAPDFVKSAEWFGGGASANRLIIISQKAYKFIIKNKLDSSLIFEPILIN